MKDKNNDLKFINALNVLTSAKIDALQNIYTAFEGNFEQAWNSNVNKFLPREPDANGKLISIDYESKKKSTLKAIFSYK